MTSYHGVRSKCTIRIVQGEAGVNQSTFVTCTGGKFLQPLIFSVTGALELVDLIDAMASFAGLGNLNSHIDKGDRYKSNDEPCECGCKVRKLWWQERRRRRQSDARWMIREVCENCTYFFRWAPHDERFMTMATNGGFVNLKGSSL